MSQLFIPVQTSALWQGVDMIERGLLQVLEKIYQDRGFDFRQYKESSLRRRIERRLKTTRVDSYQQYIELLDSDPREYKKLIDSLTIKVTEFFRDFEAWQVMLQDVLSRIIERFLKKSKNIEISDYPECSNFLGYTSGSRRDTTKSDIIREKIKKQITQIKPPTENLCNLK